MKKALIIINIVVSLVLAGSTGFLYLENRDLKDTASLTTEEQNRRLVAEINEVFSLPDETPVVAVVTDVEEFKREYTTFENAEQGDYLLFFRKNRLNVLYRQSEKRVVKTADVLVPITLELIGSEKAIEDAVDKLAEFGNQITIVRTLDETISQSFVFDIDADQSEETESIAEQLGFDVGATLPSSINPGDQTEIIVAVSATAPVPAVEETVEP